MTAGNISPHALRLATVGFTVMAAVGCFSKQFRDLQEQIEDSRAPDARQGVLELDPGSQARLELLGRTSAPTRYAERTDANRVRVVAFDFGGTKLGQGADPAGNLLPVGCKVDPTHIEIHPSKLGLGNPPPNPPPNSPPAESLELYKGMFRQYGRQVGTTVEADIAVGPVGASSRVYFSHNFLILEWRRYQLERMIDPAPCQIPHVSAIERGIAVRIVFDVRLRTIDAKMSAAFGIADLAVALARSEATVEVSYELVGTRLDLLPRDAIVITSVNEYLNALKSFHLAVSSISDAWRDYNVEGNKSPIKVNDKSYPRASLFAADQLAYYVDGVGVGDAFLHLEKVEVCQDLASVIDHHRQRIDELEGRGGELERLLGEFSEVSGAENVAELKDRLLRAVERLDPLHKGLGGKLEGLQKALKTDKIHDIEAALRDLIRGLAALERVSSRTGEIAAVNRAIASGEEKLKKAKGAQRVELRARLREDRVELDQLRRQLKLAKSQVTALKTSLAENDCSRTLRNEANRVAFVCAAAKVAAEMAAGSGTPPTTATTYLGTAECGRAASAAVMNAETEIRAGLLTSR